MCKNLFFQYGMQRVQKSQVCLSSTKQTHGEVLKTALAWAASTLNTGPFIFHLKGDASFYPSVAEERPRNSVLTFCLSL